MNIKGRLDAIEKAFAPKGIPESEKLQIIEGDQIKGQFIPTALNDTIESRKAGLMEKHGTIAGCVFVELVDKFEVA